jgi:hypothetical protein
MMPFGNSVIGQQLWHGVELLNKIRNVALFVAIGTVFTPSIVLDKAERW